MDKINETVSPNISIKLMYIPYTMYPARPGYGQERIYSPFCIIEYRIVFYNEPRVEDAFKTLKKKLTLN